MLMKRPPARAGSGNILPRRKVPALMEDVAVSRGEGDP